MMPRQQRLPRSLPSFRYLLLPLLFSLLLTLHGIFLTQNLHSETKNNYGDAKYFTEDDDTQWRLNVMMGRAAPFDNLNLMDDGRMRYQVEVPDYDFDVPSGHSIDGTNLLDSADDDMITNDNSPDKDEPAVEASSSIIISDNKRSVDNSDNSNNGKAAKQDSKEELRPKRNPKGHRFRGWMHPQQFNYWSSQSEADSDNNSNSNDNNDRAWWRNNSRCFEIDYICHRRQSNKWAYMTSNHWKHHQEVVFQPTMELKPSAWKYDGGKYNAELSIAITVDSPTRVKERGGDDEDEDDNFGLLFEQCQLSTTDTHVVLQSVFNDMVGEFYSRTLLGLYQTMMMGAQQQQQQQDGNDGNEGTAALPWEQDIQFYIHIPLKNKQVLDGHKLLTAGMLSNPKTGMAIPFLDLFQPPPPPEEEEDDNDEDIDHDGQDDQDDDDDCQCYRKMVFCGYDTYTHDEQVNSEDIDTVEDYDDRKKQRKGEEDDETEVDNVADEEGEQEEEQTTNSNDETSIELPLSDDIPPPSFNPNLKYTLWSAGSVSPYYEKSNQKDTEDSIPTRDCIKGKDCQGYANLRNLMSSNFVKHYPSLGHDIVKFRREALLAKELISHDYSGDTKEWLVVGLTQRTYRREWLNLATVMQQCNTKLNDRSVLFVKVNVEDTSSPYEQLILHRSLDVLIGVHGAQLTQAVVLPPHAHVLELLPWVPSYIRGAWVTRRNAPTPLGIIYHNTDLNHAGFSLDRTSTDLCVGVGEVGSEEEKECFLERRKIFIWDNRDFNVEPEVILTYIEKLVLFMRDDEMGTMCGEVKDRLDERFVLYNVWCAEEGEEESTLSVSHFYTDKAPPSEGEHYGLGKRKSKARRKKAST